jgi:translation initiation factor IF-3
VTPKTKEIKLRPRTEVHDLTYKTKHVREFLDQGHRVKLTVQFKGREMAHPEYGEKALNQAIAMIPGNFMVGPIKNEGRSMSILLAPGKAQ